jgi:lysozyme
MNLVEQLRRDEGVRLVPYRDQVGKLTIGIGRNLDDVGISLVEAEFLLHNDIEKATAQLELHLPWTKTLDEVRRAALVNMDFNMGIGGILQFKNTLAAIQAGRYDDAADQMLESRWAHQVGPRAHRLALQVKTGEWQ